MINSFHRLTIREVADEDGIYKTMFYEILTESCGMCRVAANFVPRLLGEEQKHNRVYVSKELVYRANADDNF